MSEETKSAERPAAAPEHVEACRRLIALRREIRDEGFRGRTLHHWLQQRTRKRRPALAERSEVVARLEEYRVSVERLRELRVKRARLEDILAPLLSARPPQVGATVTVDESGGGGSRNPRPRR
jgi:hypothetical protein